MRHFATESGKSKGQFYTPSEVSRVLANVVGINQSTSKDQTLYDPTCGSGSLLLKAADLAPHGITIYGQEMDNATTALAKMNMILHHQESAALDIYQGNTLAEPKFKKENGSLKTFDYIVANPPFSNKAWSNGLTPANDPYQRFVYGIPPNKNGDFAFLLHILRSLRTDKGKGAVILPHGVLFRGNAEADIRKRLIREGFIHGIIALPANLFYGTGIPACIIVLDKENAATRRGIFMIDASKGYAKDGNKNRLRDQDIRKIIDAYSGFLTIEKYSRMVPVAEIEKNDFNLNIPRYIDNAEPEDTQDIAAHLLGGIPDADIDALGEYWTLCPSLKKDLFMDGQRPGYSALLVDADQIKPTIYGHPEFVAFRKEIETTFTQWRDTHTVGLKEIKIGDNPKTLIQLLGDDLLRSFADTQPGSAPLIDKYDVYQHLMSYWNEIMQDDVYQVVADGWVAKPVFAINKKTGKPTGQWDCDLLPKELVISRYFQDEATKADQLEATAEAITRQLDELAEEHGGDEGLFAQSDVLNERGTVDKKAVAKRLKELKNVPTLFVNENTGEVISTDEEQTVLSTYLKLTEQEATATAKAKAARVELDKLTFAKYGTLTTDEIKTLVVDDKWMTTLDKAVNTELERVSQRLTRRITELADRYDKPLPQLVTTVDELTSRVDAHLQTMGFIW